ncbi:MAG: hypothetical protein Q8Q89_04855 [bacterium]|nr:hypothetical protein [bacterium]
MKFFSTISPFFLRTIRTHIINLCQGFAKIGKWYNKNITFTVNKLAIIAMVLIGLILPRVSPAEQLPNLTETSSDSLQTPNLKNVNSLLEINQLEIINDITKPLNDVIRSFLNGGGQGSSIIPRLKSSLGGISNQADRLNGQDTFNTNTMSIGEIIDKSKEVFILIAQILVTVLETALWMLKSILGFIS